MQEKYEDAFKVKIDLNKKIVKLGDLNKLAEENLILSINSGSAVRKVEFIIYNAQRQMFPKGNCK